MDSGYVFENADGYQYIEDNSPFTSKPEGASKPWNWIPKAQGIVNIADDVLDLILDKPEKEKTVIVQQAAKPPDNTGLWLGLGLGGLALIVFVIIMLKK